MSAWDYIIPHRLLINKSLRKASQELRDRVSAFQIEFNQRLEECETEIKLAEDEKNKQLEAFKATLVQELNDDYQLFLDVQENIIQYSECFFRRAYLLQRIDIKKKQNGILREDYAFLSAQITIVDDEIVLLRERQNELTELTKVDDIIQLSLLSGYDLCFQPTDNAKQLLVKISDALEAYQGQDTVEKYALLRLKNIIQDRSDYLPTIQYISWVIKIKRSFRKQLSSMRQDIKQERAAIRENLSVINSEIHALDDRLRYLAERIRYYWAKPITYLNADICYVYAELRENKQRLLNESPDLRRELRELSDKKRSAISEIRDKKRKRREVGNEIREMKESHSNDQWKWDSLQSEGRRLSSDIDSLSSDIDHYSSRVDSITDALDSLQAAVSASESLISTKKEARKQWATKRTRIVKLIQQYDKSFRVDRKVSDNDEATIIDTRLREIQDIRAKGAAEAQELYQHKCKEIITQHNRKAEEFETRDQILQQKLEAAEAKVSNRKRDVLIATRNLESMNKADNRFVLIRMLSESTEVTAAKSELEKARRALSGATAEKEEITTKIDALRKEINEEATEFEDSIEKCQPHYLRPTSGELLEEKKLILRQSEIGQQHREDGYENKD